MLQRLRQLWPFQTPEAKRLAILFGVVYFSQGMYHVTDQMVTLTLKDQFGLSAAQVANFGWIILIPWVIKPVYGLLSDSVPLFGRRRKSYFLLTCTLATVAALALSVMGVPTYWRMALLITVMSLGLAFTDVLTDAMMVESGKPLGLTGAFQSVQWASINVATIVVGAIGGYLAEHRNLHAGFLIAAFFPFLALVMGTAFIHEAPAKSRREEFREAWQGIKRAVGHRTMWVVAGFILFWTFSPSFGTPLFYYQTDTLKFSQQFIGTLLSLSAAGAIVGALAYGGLSRVLPLRWLLNGAIGLGVISTLAYLLYASPTSAVLIDTSAGCIGMVATLAFLDLAAKASPKQAEGTVFALLMSVYNA